MYIHKQVRLLSTIAAAFLLNCLPADADFIHPGISHNQSDLDRMRHMVAAGKDPWLSTFNKLKESRSASYDYDVKGTPEATSMKGHSDFMNDGFAAYENALMWTVTGDERHAKKCVEIFNAWVNIRRIEDQFALNNGRGPWKMCEAAEIIRYSYDGWSQTDIDKFKAMLVYPGWSGTRAPDIKSKNVSFYWNIYQGDRLRHGNQGLYAFRSMMAMGIFLDNEVIYQRSLRYLQGLPHRPDDLPYPSGPPITTPMKTGCEYYDEFKVTGHGDTEDYGYNEVLENYIWETGQSQESSRDQAHGLGGVSAIASICEIAWTQGDDLYGHLDNRLLTGWEFYFRYNLSYENTFPDQPEPWEPTVESGEFIQRSDRSGRWKSLKVNPWLAATKSRFERGNKHMTEPVYEQSLGHYKDRLLFEPEAYKWLQRGHEFMKSKVGIEDGRHASDHPGWGGLKFHRVSPGDPIQGMGNDIPQFGIPSLPCTIEAENYDHFSISGNGRTYYDTTPDNESRAYRNDDVDVMAMGDGTHVLNQLADSEWLTYTVHVPASGLYDLGVRYMARKNGQIRFEVGGKTISEEVSLPLTEGNEWANHKVAAWVQLEKGVQQLKLLISGEDAAYVLDQIIITESTGTQPPAKAATVVEAKPKPIETPAVKTVTVPQSEVETVQPPQQTEQDQISENRTLLIAAAVLLLVAVVAAVSAIRKK